MQRYDLPEPIEIDPPPETLREDVRWRIQVTGLERWRNYRGGPLVIGAVCRVWSVDDAYPLREFGLSDVAARMRVADWLIRQGYADDQRWPSWAVSNRDTVYGRKGRGFSV